MKYVKKPVVVDAIKYDGENFEEIAQSFNVANFKRDLGDYLIIPTLEGEMRANPGDYIVRGIKGEFYPVKPEIFSESFDKVDKADEILYTEEAQLAKEEVEKLTASIQEHFEEETPSFDNLVEEGKLPPIDKSKFGKSIKELANEQLAKVRENNAKLEEESNE